MLQMSQPIPHVTMNRSPSRIVAHNRVPLLHGTTPEPSDPEPFDGGSGGGEENGSDIEVSLKQLQRMQRVTQIIGHHRITSEPNEVGTT